MHLVQEFLPKKIFITSEGIFISEDLFRISQRKKHNYITVEYEHTVRIFKIHRLIAKYFIPNPNKFVYIIHKDKNYRNNNSTNLMWSNKPYTSNKNQGKNKIAKEKKRTYTSLLNEVWENHPNLENIFVSNFGRVKSKSYVYSQNGIENHYKTIKNKNYRVHILVAQTFLKNKKNKTIVNHIDGNKSNNNLSNLEWVTPSENSLNRKIIHKRNCQTRALESYKKSNITKKEIQSQKWKRLDVLDGSFEVSNMGMVRRKIIKDEKITYILKLAELTPSGYYECRLTIGGNSNNSKQTFRRGIHQLVALAWLPNPELKKTVNHLDRDHYNNRLSNLEWATQIEQAHHSIKTSKK